MPTPRAARTAKALAGTSAPTIPSPMGMNARPAMYGMSATAGAIRKTPGRSAAAGMTSSFWTNFAASAMSWAQPCQPPAYIGPSRTAWRHELVLGLADEQREDEEGGDDGHAPDHCFQNAHASPSAGFAADGMPAAPSPGSSAGTRGSRGPQVTGSGTPGPGRVGDRCRRRGGVPLARLLAPGQALEARAASMKDFFSGLPSKPSGSSSGRIGPRRGRGSRRSRCRTSRRSRARTTRRRRRRR